MQDQPKTIVFTQQAYDKMLARRKEIYILLDEVTERIKVAREMGDLSENGAYKYGKFEKGNLLRELRALKFKIENGEVGEVKDSYSQIEFGATFTLISSGKEMTFQLTNEYESDPSAQKISHKSPIGSAVLHKTVGDVVIVQTPRGEQEFEVVKVE